MSENIYCSKCGSETEFKKGIGKKSGKPYQGYKCVNPDCNNFDFIPDEEGFKKVVISRELPKPPNTKPPNNGDSATKSMLMSYAKDLVVAMMASGIAPPNPSMAVIGIYQELLKEINK